MQNPKGFANKEVSDSIFFVKKHCLKKGCFHNIGLWSCSSTAFNVVRVLFGSADRYLSFVGFSDTAFAGGESMEKWLLREREREFILLNTFLP